MNEEEGEVLFLEKSQHKIKQNVSHTQTQFRHSFVTADRKKKKKEEPRRRFFSRAGRARILKRESRSPLDFEASDGCQSREGEGQLAEDRQ